ncbi:hypothetical protein KSP40_PGU004464 [Platanthera guangdongensis]|uniref:Uncharacterized protein n=1 Tax=Platanthera guangdongensis TaxID=2320717 RepID=A0ABR2LTR0_9ASPA
MKNREGMDSSQPAASCRRSFVVAGIGRRVVFVDSLLSRGADGHPFELSDGEVVTKKYMVCRPPGKPIMHDKRFLDEAVARYEGFLCLIKRCSETPMDGKVLEHDDTDSDRSTGKKLDSGFSATTKMSDYAYGLRYWRAGAMNRGVTCAGSNDLFSQGEERRRAQAALFALANTSDGGGPADFGSNEEGIAELGLGEEFSWWRRRQQRGFRLAPTALASTSDGGRDRSGRAEVGDEFSERRQR